MTLTWPAEACSQLQAHSSSAGSVAHSPVPLSVVASLVWATECHLIHAFLPQCPTVHLPVPRSVVGRGKTLQAGSQVTKVCIEDMNSLFGGFAVLGTDVISAVSLGVPGIVGSRITGQHLLRLIFLHYWARRDNSTSAGWSTWRNSLQSPHEPFSGPKCPSFAVVWLDRCADTGAVSRVWVLERVSPAWMLPLGRLPSSQASLLSLVSGVKGKLRTPPLRVM